MKLYALAQLHGEFLAVGRPIPLGGKLRHDFEVWRDINEFVAHRRVDDAADKGAGLSRVKHVGIVREAYAKLGGKGRRC